METEIITTKDLDISLETHIFTCVKYITDKDNGFTCNLYLLLEAIQHSDKVQDEGIKLIAKGLLSSVMHHQIQKHNMETVNKRLEEYKKKKADEIIS